MCKSYVQKSGTFEFLNGCLKLCKLHEWLPLKAIFKDHANGCTILQYSSVTVELYCILIRIETIVCQDNEQVFQLCCL